MTVRLLSLDSAAEQLDCSRTHLYGLIAAGHLRPVDIAASGSKTKTRVRQDDLDKYVESKTRKVAS